MSRSFRVIPLHRRHESVTSASHCFNEAGIVSRIAERVADFVDGLVEAMVEVNEGVLGPEVLLKLLAGNDLSRLFQEHGENLEGLLLQLDPDPLPAKFSGPEIDFEDSEMDHMGQIVWFHTRHLFWRSESGPAHH